MPIRTPNNPNINFLISALRNTGVEVIGIRDRRAMSLNFNVLHIHFPSYFHSRKTTVESIVWSLMFLALLGLTKLFRKRIVYQVHDIFPTGIYRPWLYRPFSRAVTYLCDAYIFLSSRSREQFYLAFKGEAQKDFEIIRHGSYPTTILAASDKAQRREALSGAENAFVVGLLGDIKPYKGVDILPLLPQRLSSGRPLRVVIAGRIEKGYEAEAHALIAKVDPKSLRWINERLSDKELDDLIQSVDVTLLPYKKGTNSGLAHLILSNRSRLLGSNLSMFRDLQEEVGESWVRYYKSDGTDVSASLLRELDMFADAEVSDADDEKLRNYLNESSYTVAAERCRALYERI